MSIDIYNAPRKTIMVMCHTSNGDHLDIDGRFYEKGKEYRMSTEIIKPTPDTNNQECILCWIDFNEFFGNRFAVKGNVYHKGEPYWPDFRDYFVCPLARERNDKLERLGI